MRLASEVCIYTNDHITVEEIDIENEEKESKSRDKGKK